MCSVEDKVALNIKLNTCISIRRQIIASTEFERTATTAHLLEPCNVAFKRLHFSRQHVNLRRE